MLVISRKALSKDRELTRLKLEARDRINKQTAILRSQFKTEVEGQDSVYLQKQDEARRYLSYETPPEDLTDFPFLRNEVGITRSSMRALAELWLEKARETAHHLASLEGLRMSTLQFVNSAFSAEDVSYHEDIFMQSIRDYQK